MKVRMLAVIPILTLAAWLPIQAQQAASPAAPAPQLQTPATPSEKDQSTAKHPCCCDPAKKTGPEATAATADQPAMECCHGKGTGTTKASCCAGKDAKDMACCGMKDKDGKVVMNCCQGAPAAMCTAKNGMGCCNNPNAKDGKGCCGGIKGQCAGRASGK